VYCDQENVGVFCSFGRRAGSSSAAGVARKAFELFAVARIAEYHIVTGASE
jgi:hypothetical protein